MYRKIISITVLLLIAFNVFCAEKSSVSIKVNTKSLTNKLKTSFVISKLSTRAHTISINIKNEGNVTEYINDIDILLNNNYSITDTSLLYFGSYEMEQAGFITRGVKDLKINTESVLLINEKGNFFKVGILSWDIFRPVISVNNLKQIKINAQGENKPIKPGETIKFEKIVVETSNSWQDLLYAYGEQIAQTNNISLPKIPMYKGWATYDYYSGKFTEEEVKLNIDQLKSSKIDANIIQIDGGWWAERGDYLTSRSNIAGGMKGMAKMIKDNGYMAGIHFDGFRAENTAEVFKNHPDWFLKNQKNEPILAEYLKHGKIVQRVYFDFSNPAVREYFKNIMKTIRVDWGYQYFKIDFTWFGLNDRIFKSVKNDTITEVRAFDNSMTSMERTRAGLKAMREGIDTAFFLGCSSVFSSNIGIVDGLRTGGDISPYYESYESRCLQNACNFYLHKTVVYNDADYIVVRNKDDEEPERAWGNKKFGGTVTHNEATMWANYVALFGGVKISSDNLKTLREERKTLVRNAVSLNTCDRFIPIDFWDKARGEEDAYNIMLGTNNDGVYLALFNWNNTELGIELSNIPTENLQLVNCEDIPFYNTLNKSIDLKLKARTSVIFKLQNGVDFDVLRKKIKYEFTK